tara:strand:- start:82391 stop:82795 length:405 start_codon:yes stop_codon:yes gene_type:complete
MISLRNRKNEDQLFREGVLGDISLTEFVVLWSYTFPLDKVYRDKHSIPFNSELHRSLDPMDMMVELGQDLAIRHAIENELEKKKDPSIDYDGGRGKYFSTKRNVSKVSQEDIDKAFDQIDITNIKTNDDGSLTL